MAFDGKQIKNLTVVGGKLANLTVTTGKIADSAIDSNKLATDSVTTIKIVDGNVTTAKLNSTGGSEAVTTAVIRDNAVTTAKIADANVTLAKLASNSVDSSKIVDASITGGDIASATITGSNIASNTVAAANLVTTYEAGLLYKDGSRAMTGSLDLGTSNKIVNLANPTSAQDAATKSYVDAAVTGLDLKASVRLLQASNVTLSGGTPNTVDSVSVALNDRILVTGQSTASQNGIYTVTTVGTGSDGTWTRATDADSSSEVTAGMFTFVEEGTTYHDTGWVLITNNTITLGSTALSFTQFSGAGTYLNGFGLLLSGNTFSVDFENTNGNINPVGTQSAGSSNKVARADHVHAHDNQAGGSLHSAVVADTAASNTTTNADGTNGFETSARALKVDASPFGYQGKATSNVDLNSHKIINVTDPTNPQDAATKAYVDTAAASSTSASTSNKWMTASTTTADGDQACGTGITTTPKGYVQVFVNGLEAIQTGTKSTSEVYFSADSGVTARALNAVVATDKAYWNGSVAGYELATTDLISFDYVV